MPTALEQAETVVKAGNDSDAIREALTYTVDIRARTGWTTGGHTATDVPIYCYNNPYCLKFRGSHENTQLTKLMSDFLGGLDIDAVTGKLANFNATAPKLGPEEE